MPAETVKRCSKCGIAKPVSEFYRDARSKDGLSSNCKKCNYEAHRRYIKAHPEKEHEKHQRYIKAHPEKEHEKHRRYMLTPAGKLAGARRSHKRRTREKAFKSEGDLTLEQLEYILKNQKNRCNICGKQFTKTRQPTVDHIVPLSQGGRLTSDNVQLLCRSCNAKKRDRLHKGFIQSWTQIEATES